MQLIKSLEHAPSSTSINRAASASVLNDRIWTPPHLLALRVLATRYDCSRISGLGMTSAIRGRAMMGYSRVGSPLLFRASRPWTFAGYSDAGSTCSPSLGMLATAVDDFLWSVGTLGVRRPRAPVRSSCHASASPRRPAPSCWQVRSPRRLDGSAPLKLAPSD